MAQNNPLENKIEYIVVLCSCPDDMTAKTIASKLVQAKIAACVSILPAVTSVYHWQGAIEQQTEVQLLIKSKQQQFEHISAQIRSIHPYETPEIIAIPIVAGDTQYLTWINETVT